MAVGAAVPPAGARPDRLVLVAHEAFDDPRHRTPGDFRVLVLRAPQLAGILFLFFSTEVLVFECIFP